MAWYYGTYSCGHDGRVNIVGPGKDRKWKKEREFSGLCPECYKEKIKEEREQKNKEAEIKSTELELPKLEGSEKQVAWANTLRLKVIEEYETLVEKLNQSNHSKIAFHVGYGERIIVSREELADTMDYMLNQKTSSKFWIDHRYNIAFGEFVVEYREYKTKNDIPTDVKEEMEAVEIKLTVTPKNNLKKGIVELKYNEQNTILSAKYIKDDDFISLVKELNYKWNGCNWIKEITEYTGTIDDRAAELGNRLLESGFTVRFETEEAKQLAVKGTFLKENDRWIKYNSKKNAFAITWNKKSDILYEAAKKLPGSKWENGYMLVKIEFYSDVQDFAETMGFSFSKTAEREIQNYKIKEDQFVREEVNVVNEEEDSDEEKLRKSLESDGTIISDLLDD